MQKKNESWKTRTLVIGTLMGAAVGFGTAYLLNRTAEESGGKPPSIQTKDAIKMVISTIGLVRGIASLGDK